jgi:hypothetical protein
MMEAPDSSETSVLTRATQQNIPEDSTVQKLYAIDMQISYLNVLY